MIFQPGNGLLATPEPAHRPTWAMKEDIENLAVIATNDCLSQSIITELCLQVSKVLDGLQGQSDAIWQCDLLCTTSKLMLDRIQGDGVLSLCRIQAFQKTEYH